LIDDNAHCGILVMLAHHDDAMLKAAVINMRAGNQKPALQAGRSAKRRHMVQMIVCLTCIFSNRHYLH
jgi:hypothetical protein